MHVYLVSYNNNVRVYNNKIDLSISGELHLQRQ